MPKFTTLALMSFLDFISSTPDNFVVDCHCGDSIIVRDSIRNVVFTVSFNGYSEKEVFRFE